MTSLATDAAKEELNRIFGGIRELLNACKGANARDRATIAISALIDNGINTRPRILGSMKKLYFNPNQTIVVLDARTGIDPSRCHWRLDEAGIYIANQPSC